MPLEQTIPIVYYKRQSPLILAIDFLYPYPPPNIRTSYNENILRIVEILTIEGVQAATWVKSGTRQVEVSRQPYKERKIKQKKGRTPKIPA
jgi:hypothetical protein